MANHQSDASVGRDPELEVVARLDDRPGNPALTPDGRLIVSLHPFPYGEPSPYHVVEVMEDGSTQPFPNEEWSTAPDEEGVGLSAVIGVRADRRGGVWLMGLGGGAVVRSAVRGVRRDRRGVVLIMDMGGELPPKLGAWDTRRDELHRLITI